MSSRFSFALFFFVAAAASACSGASSSPTEPEPRVCTDIGCHDGLVLRFRPDAGWAPGAYRVRLEIDGSAISCEGQLPLRSCDTGNTFSCSHSSVRIGESGCALPVEQHGLAQVFIDSTTVKSLAFSIERDGVEIAHTTLQPSYQRSQPNGPDCPPVCANALIVVPLTRAAAGNQAP